MGKRILLFLGCNLLIMVMISVIASFLGLGGYYTQSGLDYVELAKWSLLWGFLGSFISLAMSRWVAKFAMGVKVIDPNNAGSYRYLVDMVHDSARKAGLRDMPEVGIYDSPETNAFATGPTKSRSLVAFSTGITQQMSKDALEGVAAHEVAHIQNGDMVTMTLIQGLVNAFVHFAARVAAWAVASRFDKQHSFWIQFALITVFQIVFMLLAMVVVGWFSRRREFRADEGSARLVGKEKMIAGLESLRQMVPGHETEEAFASLKINGLKKSGWRSLMSTHPPLDERIAALRALQI